MVSSSLFGSTIDILAQAGLGGPFALNQPRGGGNIPTFGALPTINSLDDYLKLLVSGLAPSGQMAVDASKAQGPALTRPSLFPSDGFNFYMNLLLYSDMSNIFNSSFQELGKSTTPPVANPPATPPAQPPTPPQGQQPPTPPAQPAQATPPAPPAPATPEGGYKDLLKQLFAAGPGMQTPLPKEVDPNSTYRQTVMALMNNPVDVSQSIFQSANIMPQLNVQDYTVGNIDKTLSFINTNLGKASKESKAIQEEVKAATAAAGAAKKAAAEAKK